MADNERINARIPADSKWSAADLENKSSMLGIKKSDFIIDAIDLLMGFETEFIKEVYSRADKLNIPVSTFIQNTITRVSAQEQVEDAVWGVNPRIRYEFMMVDDKPLTGEDLKNYLVDMYTREEKQKKEKFLKEHGISADE